MVLPYAFDSMHDHIDFLTRSQLGNKYVIMNGPDLIFSELFSMLIYHLPNFHWSENHVAF